MESAAIPRAPALAKLVPPRKKVAASTVRAETSDTIKTPTKNVMAVDVPALGLVNTTMVWPAHRALIACPTIASMVIAATTSARALARHVPRRKKDPDLMAFAASFRQIPTRTTNARTANALDRDLAIAPNNRQPMALFAPRLRNALRVFASMECAARILATTLVWPARQPKKVKDPMEPAVPSSPVPTLTTNA